MDMRITLFWLMGLNNFLLWILLYSAAVNGVKEWYNQWRSKKSIRFVCNNLLFPMEIILVSNNGFFQNYKFENNLLKQFIKIFKMVNSGR